MTNPALRQALAAMDAELLALMKAVVALEEAHEAAVLAVGEMEYSWRDEILASAVSAIDIPTLAAEIARRRAEGDVE